MKRIRLMIIDDYEPLRLGLRSAFELQHDILMVGDFGDGETAVREAQRRAPDVVLMDVRMPGMDSIERKLTRPPTLMQEASNRKALRRSFCQIRSASFYP